MLTDTQADIVEFVRDYRSNRSRGPTYQEIADGIGVVVRAVQYQLDKLEGAGIVERERMPTGRAVPRSLKIISMDA